MRDLKEDKNQPRIFFNQEAIDGIAETYKDHGVIQAIEIDEDNIIVTGAMRFRAAKKAGIETVPVKVLGKLNQDDRFVRQAVENMNRSDFTTTENEAVVMKLKKIYPHLSRRELGKKIGKSGSFIDRYSATYDAPDYIRKPMNENKLDPATAWELTSIPKQYKKDLTRTVVRDGLGQREVRILRERLETATPKEVKQLLKQDYKGKGTSEIAFTARSIAPSRVEKPSVAYAELEELSNGFLNFLKANRQVIFSDSGYERRVFSLLNRVRDEIDDYIGAVPKKLKE